MMAVVAEPLPRRPISPALVLNIAPSKQTAGKITQTKDQPYKRNRETKRSNHRTTRSTWTVHVWTVIQSRCFGAACTSAERSESAPAAVPDPRIIPTSCHSREDHGLPRRDLCVCLRPSCLGLWEMAPLQAPRRASQRYWEREARSGAIPPHKDRIYERGNATPSRRQRRLSFLRWITPSRHLLLACKLRVRRGAQVQATPKSTRADKGREAYSIEFPLTRWSPLVAALDAKIAIAMVV